MTKLNRQSPEMEEFEKKNRILEDLETNLSQLELEYATFHGDTIFSASLFGIGYKTNV